MRKRTTKKTSSETSEELSLNNIKANATIAAQKVEGGQITLSDQHVALTKIEDGIYRKAMDIVNGVMSFHEVSPNDLQPPEEWVRALGPKRALQKFRIALSAWKSTKECPSALMLAVPMATAIFRARIDTAPLETAQNVSPMMIPVTDMPRYEVKEVKD